MKHKITHKLTGNVFTVDETVGITRIMTRVPLFFRTPHGKRETYTMHRGFLIVRNTVQFTGCKPERKTAIYLYTDDDPETGRAETHCIPCDARDQREAKRIINRILEEGEYDRDTIARWCMIWR